MPPHSPGRSDVSWALALGPGRPSTDGSPLLPRGNLCHLTETAWLATGGDKSLEKVVVERLDELRESLGVDPSSL